MAQMKNKINETNKYPHRVFREYEGTINRLPTVGARGVNVGVRG